METRKITIPIDPVGKGRPRFTRNGHAYTPAKTVAAELIIGTYARHQWKDEPLKQQVNARMTFFMPIPKGVAKKYLADFQSEKLGHLKLLMAHPILDPKLRLIIGICVDG